MSLSRNQMVLIGIFVAGILIYLLYFRKKPIKKVIGAAQFFNPPKKDVVKDDVGTNESTQVQQATETNYVGAQDCIESCNSIYDKANVECLNKYNGGVGTDLCLQNVLEIKNKCLPKCTNAYPMNQNFNDDVRDNFDVILSRSLFGQGYV